MNGFAAFEQTGWLTFAEDARLKAWVDAVRDPALASARDPANARWHRCDGTWFVGVNALGNDERGRVGAGPPLAGSVMDFLEQLPIARGLSLDAGQVSILYPGYPRPREGESPQAFAYRRDRDAAHVDGLHPSGPAAARHQNEFQAYLLGIPITRANRQAAPLVVWEGSHHLIAAFFRKAFEGLPPQNWPTLDLTAAYKAVRREIFANCSRKVVHVPLGGAYLLHRFALHGVAPWGKTGRAEDAGRAIVYFRPEGNSVEARRDWLDLA